MTRIYFVLISLLYLGLVQLPAQSSFDQSPFIEIQLNVDTTIFTWTSDRLSVQGKDHLPFQYNDEDEVVEVILYLDSGENVKLINLASSADFELIDYLVRDGDFVKFKVRFKAITRSNFLKFIFEITSLTDEKTVIEIPLFPFTQTQFQLYIPSADIFIGEERQFRLVSTNNENILLTNQWTIGTTIDSWIRKGNNELIVHLIPNQTGEHEVSLKVPLRKPRLVDGVPVYESEEILKKVTVKGGRLTFLQTDINEITLPKNPTEAVEIALDNHRTLQLNKTYRIEEQETPGGALVAEVFTRTLLSNDKVLCTMRVYAEHRKTDGYLYIKDGDDARYIMNVDITPDVRIDQILLRRPGKDWIKSNIVFPGEVLDVRFEGVGLHKSNFTFEGIVHQKIDSLIRSEILTDYRIHVPIDIHNRKIEIFDRSRSIGQFLNVTEVNRPKEFDFIKLETHGISRSVSEIGKPIYVDDILTDLVISFYPELLDFSDQLYGKQEFEINIKITNKKGTLIELYRFDKIVICPGDNSPRFGRYPSENCWPSDINLNNYLTNKTSDLEEWSRIELVFKHSNESYESSKFTRKVELILRRKTSFDIDVSFPAGLLILKAGEGDIASFSGISLAMIAQMSFYQPGRIAKYRPYKVGAGFIAIDAFNFSETSQNRDVALVVLGSVYPISSERKLTFPLYLGFGYLLQDEKLFFTVGPGIRVSF